MKAFSWIRRGRHPANGALITEGHRLQDQCSLRTRGAAHSLFMALVTLMVVRGVTANENPHVIDVAAIPQTARSIADFVPSGWRIEATITGDLNGDAKPDTVLELIEDRPATVNGVANELYRALLVLLQTSTGELRRVGIGSRLLRCTTCFGALAGPEGGGAEIKIAKGVLVVDELWGSRESVHTTLRFRFEPASSRVVQIGQDIERDDRATGAHLKESRNFLTGVKLTEGMRYDEKREQLTKIPPKREPVSRLKRFIEDVDYRDFDR